MDKGISKAKRRNIMTVILCVSIILIPVVLWDFNKILKKNETLREYQKLNEWEKQGIEALEYKLNGYFGILESAAVFLETQDIYGAAAEVYLQKLQQKEGTAFRAISVSKDAGDSEEIKKRVTGVSADGYVELTVPLYDQMGGIKGSITAEMDSGALELFGQYTDSDEIPHVIVTDRMGDYFFRDEEWGVNHRNILEDLSDVELTIKREKLQDRMKWNSKARFEISSGDDEWIVVLGGTERYGLCVFVLTEKENIEKNVEVYQKDVIYLSLKLLIIFAVSGGVYIYFRMEERKYVERLNRQLLLNEETYRITARHSNSCIFTYDVESEKLQFLNEMYKEFGFDQELLSVPVLLKKIENKEAQACINIRILLDSIREQKTYAKEKVRINLNGQDRYLLVSITNIFDENGRISRSVGSIEDITNTERTILMLQKEQESLEKVAKNDMLTGALSRTWGTHLIEGILEQSPKQGDVHAFIIADLDNFKKLNDNFGHSWGDRALYDVVGVMKSNCRSQDVVCRLGGDEFVIFLRDIHRDALERKVKELSEKLVIIYEKEHCNIQITASMGVAVAPDCGVTFRELYECADRALYQVKKGDKNGYHIV